MSGVHIVTHCFSKTAVQYAVFLRCHLSSIVQNSDKVDVKVSICYTESDTAVVEIMDEFQDLLGKRLEHVRLTPGELFRRAIGRNRVALTTDADLVWHCDVDHVMGPGCLTHLWRVWSSWRLSNQPEAQKPILYWPGEIQIHKDHSTGDKFWQSHVNFKGLVSVNPREFVSKTYYKAIGGIQIVDGDYSRANGYLADQLKWLVPTDGDKPFPEFRDDCKFRNCCANRGKIDRIDLPNLYRLRHSVVTYRGR